MDALSLAQLTGLATRRYVKISVGNHMISSAIWDKSTRVNFLKTNKFAQARRASAICSL